MKKIHVDRHAIERNFKEGSNLPVILVLKDGKTINAHECIIYGQDGKEAARVVYSPDEVVGSNTRVWMQTEGKVELIRRGKNDVYLE